jgi:hypothetical protein
MGLADRPGQVTGPSAIYPEGSEVCSLGLVLYVCTVDRPGLGAGPSAVLTRESVFLGICTTDYLGPEPGQY